MATVPLLVGGRRYELHCRDGEEAHLLRLAAVVDGKMALAAQAIGPGNEPRQLLLAALLLADELAERAAATAPPASPAPDGADATEGLAEALDLLADRIERFVETLEEAGTAS